MSDTNSKTIPTDGHCPECQGVARSMHRAGRKNFFRTVLDPEYQAMQAPTFRWSKEFYVCAGCLGSGLRKDWTARVLSGEFNPQSVTKTPPA